MLSRLVGDVVPVLDRLVGLVGLTRVGRTHHIDDGHARVVGFDVALQLMNERAARLIRIGQGLRSVWLRRTENYADVFFDVQHSLLPCPASPLAARRCVRNPT